MNEDRAIATVSSPDHEDEWLARTTAEGLTRVNPDEVKLLLPMLSGDSVGDLLVAGRTTYLSILRRADSSMAVTLAAGLLSQFVSTCDPNLLVQRASELRAVLARCSTLAGSESAQSRSASRSMLLPELPDGRFLQLAHETILGRGCQARELSRWQYRLETGEANRADVVATLVDEASRIAARDAERLAEDSRTFHVMGTGQRVTLADWQARLQAAEAAASPLAAPAASAPCWYTRTSASVGRVSVITSLYAGGAHIERFLSNITSQREFAERAELIIVDAASPDGEGEVIERYRQRWPNIRYVRTPSRIGIYEAWNMAVGLARGDYLTSANVDDLRRTDSLLQQAALLDTLPFVDVVYQDFLYTLDPDLPYERVAAIGFRSSLPLVTPHGLMTMNPPHNAPMWRRHLHDELGLFDAGLQSAGDYDFWMRCVVAGKVFWKLNEPHVVYYQNPHGVSTRPDTRGHEETREVHRRYGRDLVSENLVLPLAALRERLGIDASTLMEATSLDREHLVHEALLACARASWRRVPDRTDERRREDRPLRLLVDGDARGVGTTTGPGWTSLAHAWAGMPEVELHWLDRGHVPTADGIRVTPFPAHRTGACAADSVLIQHVCELYGIDSFISAGATSPTATPTLALVADVPGTVGQGTAARERELATAFARRLLCVSEAVRRELTQGRLQVPQAAAEVAPAGDAAQAIAKRVVELARELRDRRDAGDFGQFFAEWTRLRELQIGVQV